MTDKFFIVGMTIVMVGLLGMMIDSLVGMFLEKKEEEKEARFLYDTNATIRVWHSEITGYKRFRRICEDKSAQDFEWKDFRRMHRSTREYGICGDYAYHMIGYYVEDED